MIRIVTDSSCDLPDEVLEQSRIAVVPLTIRFGEDEFVDREQISIDEFWDRLLAGEDLPETAAPPVGRFLETFRSLESEGAEGIVVVTLSSRISATHQSAVLAADQFSSGIPVSVVDSRLVSTALGLAAMAAAQAAAEGTPMDEVAAIAAGEGNLFAALDTLEFLKRGGRIGSAAAFFGSLLSVKPLLSFADGEVSAAGRVRTRKRALASIHNHVADVAASIDRIGVVHSEAPDLDDFLEQLEADGHDVAVVSRLGPVVGTHAGPGVIGVVYRLASNG